MSSRFQSVLAHLQSQGYDLKEVSEELTSLDNELNSRYGDIVSVVAEIRHELLSLKDQLSGDPLMTWGLNNCGSGARNVNEDIAKEYQHGILTNEEFRESIRAWLSTIEKYNIRPTIKKNAGLRYKSGGMKSVEGVQRQIDNPNWSTYQDRMRDLTRGRLICRDLREVVKVGRGVLRNKNRFWLWGGYNYFSSPLTLKNGKPRFFFSYMASYLFDPYTPYELQVVTERAHAVAEFNHPILRHNTVTLPEPDLNYVKAMTWGAALLDYEEYTKFSEEK